MLLGVTLLNRGKRSLESVNAIFLKIVICVKHANCLWLKLKYQSPLKLKFFISQTPFILRIYFFISKNYLLYLSSLLKEHYEF